MARKTCPRPEACTAARRGPCAVCHPTSFVASATAWRGYWGAAARARQAERLKAQHADPAFRAAAAAAAGRTLQRRWDDPDLAERERERSRRTMRRNHQDPAFVARLDAARRRPRSNQESRP